MKKLLLAAALLLPSLSYAEDVAVNFKAVPLVSFVSSTYGAMLKRDFVMSPELMAMEKPISVSVKSIKSEDLPRFVESVLSSQGVKSELRDGVYFLSPAFCDGGPCAARNGGTPIALSGAVAAVPSHTGAVQSVPLELASVGALSAVGGAYDVPDLERDVYNPLNRRADFLVAVLNAAFGNKPASVAGSAIVLTAKKDQLAKVVKLVEQLDQSPHKVRVSATFVEVSSNESSGLGVSLVAQVLGAKLGVKLGDSSAGSLTLSTGNFQAVIDALSADGRFKQVAAPTAVVDSYEASDSSFGDSVPTIASTSLDRNGTPVQQVQYQQSGVVLKVQPAVLGNGRINVAVDGQVSSFSATTTGVNGSPTLSKRQVRTNVTLDDGELLLIGGLNNDRTSDNRSGFSFLPKGWVVGSQFKSSTDLVLILSASVIR